MATDIQKRPFTFDEYFKLVEAGILKEDDHVELLDGEILLMPPIGEDHDSTTIRFTRSLISKLGDRIMLLPAGTMKLSKYSAPEPDFALLRPRSDFYRGGHPQPADTFALVELSDSSLSYDQGRKLNAYARARIPEYWIANLRSWHIARYREPSDIGYAEPTIFSGAEPLSFAAFPDVTFSVDELLGPAEPPAR